MSSASLSSWGPSTSFHMLTMLQGATVYCRGDEYIGSLLPVWPLARCVASGESLELHFPSRRLDSNLNGWLGRKEPAFASSTVWWKAAHLSNSLILFMFFLAASTVVPLPWNTSYDPSLDQAVVKGWCGWHGSALQLAVVTGHVWAWPVFQLFPDPFSRQLAFLHHPRVTGISLITPAF